jgi:hypothetical protein
MGEKGNVIGGVEPATGLVASVTHGTVEVAGDALEAIKDEAIGRAAAAAVGGAVGAVTQRDRGEAESDEEGTDSPEGAEDDEDRENPQKS